MMGVPKPAQKIQELVDIAFIHLPLAVYGCAHRVQHIECTKNNFVFLN